MGTFSYSTELQPDLASVPISAFSTKAKNDAEMKTGHTGAKVGKKACSGKEKATGVCVCMRVFKRSFHFLYSHMLHIYTHHSLERSWRALEKTPL